MGILQPKHRDAAVGTLERIACHISSFDGVAQTIERCVDATPTHQAFVDRYWRCRDACATACELSSW